MMEFLNEYGTYVMVVAFIFGGGAYTYWSIKSKGSRKTLDDYRGLVHQLMLVAEKKFESGDDKYFYVVERLYPLLPDPVKALFTISDIQKWVQQVYDDVIMDYLDDGKLNDSNEQKVG